jgi:hypothetical protein
VIVAEFFDIGHARALPWQRRRKASHLPAVPRDPARGFDAVVIGEPQRASYGNSPTRPRDRAFERRPRNCRASDAHSCTDAIPAWHAPSSTRA